MDLLFRILLVLHIVFGSLGLIVGTGIMFLRKGDRRHRMLGKLFTTGMVTAATVAMGLATIHFSPFLMLVGLWTLFLAGSGYAYIHEGPDPFIEWPRMLLRILALMMLLAGVIFIGWGISLVVAGKTFGIVLLAFGGAGLAFIRQDLLYVRRGAPAGTAAMRHFQRMIGAYIAAATAFLVVNINGATWGIPGFVLWLLPSALLVPLILRWSARRSRRMQP